MPPKGETTHYVLCIASLGGRRLAVRIAMEHPIGTLPRTPFASSRRSPQGETRDLRRKTASHILHVPFRRFPPLVAGATTFPPQFGGAAKGKRLNGQARRLTSPHLEVLCRTSTGDYKAPLCCELLMKGLLCGFLLSHRSAGGRWCRKAPKGGKPPEVADRRNAYHAI